jgi:archaellum component FlaC
MAGTSVLKLKVDDKEYNASIKEARKGLLALEESLNKAGKSFSNVDKSVEQYVREIGKMETSSKTAKGRISELSNAFVDLSTVYSRMSKQMQQSDVGKALEQSLQSIKERAVESKRELEQLGKELETTVPKPDVMQGIRGGGSNFEGALSVFAGNMATKATDALMQLGNEVLNVTKESMQMAAEAEGVESAFARLNNPGLLDGLRQATHGTVSDLDLMKAAVKFDDFKLPLSELGTMLAFAQQKAKDTGQSVDYLVDSIVTGLGRQSTQILDNLGLSQAEVKERTKETGDMTKAVGDIIREQMAAAGDYVETAADRTTKSAVDMQNAMLEFGKTMQEATGMASWDELNNTLESEMVRALNDIVKGAMEVKDVFIAVNAVVSPLSSAMKDFGDMSTVVLSSVKAAAWAALGPLSELLGLLRLIGEMSSKGTVEDAVDKANRNAADKQKFTVYLPAEDNWRNNPQSAAPKTPKVRTPKVRPSRKTGGGGRSTKTTPPPPEGSIEAQRQEVQKLEKAWNRAATDALRDKYLSALKDARKELDRMTGKTPLEGSIDAQAKKVSELQAAWRAAANDDSRKRISAQIVEAEQRLDEMMGKVEQAQGISITNQSGMGEYINILQQQLSKADYGSAIYKTIAAQLTDMTTLQTLVGESLKLGLGTAMFDVADELGRDFWTRAMEGGVENIDWQGILDKINEERKKRGLEQQSLDFESGTFSNKDTKKSGLAQADKFISGLSSVSSGLQQMGIKLPDGVTKLLGAAQGLMTIIQGVNSIISIFSTSTATAQITAENANTGMLAGLTAAVEGLQMTIAAKTFLPGLANGGIVGHAAGGYSVPGNSYSGDNIPIMANAGEVVLNRAQTGVLASALSEQSAPATSTPYVSGEKIYLGMENYLKRIGRGEIVTSRH